MISFDFGSGVVVGDEGQILTAYHVVRGAAQLIVRAADRQEFEAEIIAADPRSDLAVIVPVAIPGMPAPRLKPIALGDAGQLRKGSFLIALGNPFNAAQDGKPSASWGILSNLARRVEPEQDEMSMGPRRMTFPNYPTLLQLDSKLNLGMSGGAVVNLKGELVGLTTMASSPAGFDAMAGYAIPIDKIGRRAVETLKEGKEIEYGFLGIKAHLNSTNRVEEVTPNSPADQGQLQANDEILAVDDTPIVDFDSLILAINSHAPGDEVRLKLRRAGKELTKTVVLAKYPVDSDMIATNRPPAWRGLRVDYQSTVIRQGAGPPFLRTGARRGARDRGPGRFARRPGRPEEIPDHPPGREDPGPDAAPVRPGGLRTERPRHPPDRPGLDHRGGMKRLPADSGLPPWCVSCTMTGAAGLRLPFRRRSQAPHLRA